MGVEDGALKGPGCGEGVATTLGMLSGDTCQSICSHRNAHLALCVVL